MILWILLPVPRMFQSESKRAEAGDAEGRTMYWLTSSALLVRLCLCSDLHFRFSLGVISEHARQCRRDADQLGV